MNEPTISGAVRTAPGAGSRATSTSKWAWLLPAGLITLGLVPILANALRRIALSLGAEDSTISDGIAVIPLPALLHVLGATIFVILGAFQFSDGIRRRWPSWHRIAGRVLILAGLLVGLSGLWLNLFVSLPAGSGELLYLFRLLGALGLVLCIVLGFTAIRRGDIRRHRVWMIRAFAIALGAGTQVFTLGFGEAIFGKSQLSVALLNGAGWVINLTVAELTIRRRSGRRGGPAAASFMALP
jgi:uncharacterized membrane protein